MERILERYERCSYAERQLKEPDLESPVWINLNYHFIIEKQSVTFLKIALCLCIYTRITFLQSIN